MVFQTGARTMPGPRSRTWLIVGVIGVMAAFAGSALPQLIAAKKIEPAAPLKQDAAISKLNDPTPAWPDAPSPAAMLARLGVGTAIVLVLCVGTLLAGKRWLVGARPVPETPGPQRLRLLEVLPLGNRCAVHLLQAGGQQVLVGIDATGMKAVIALNDGFEPTLDGMADEVTRAPAVEHAWRGPVAQER